MLIVEVLVKIQEAEGIKYKYFYKMMKNVLILNEEYTGSVSMQSYGIEIERQDLVNDSIVKVVKNSVNHISPNRYKVHNVLKYLHETTVSPIHLVDIVGREVDEDVFDYNSELELCSIRS